LCSGTTQSTGFRSSRIPLCQVTCVRKDVRHDVWLRRYSSPASGREQAAATYVKAQRPRSKDQVRTS
jgi:hypothetical protein